MADYGFAHDGAVFTPNRTPNVAPEHNDDRNRAIESAELERWGTRPDHAVAYYAFPAEPGGGLYRASFRPLLQGAIVTTWLGAPLGAIVRATVYRNNFGARLVSIRVRGSNGADYSGRGSWDNGQVITLRRIRGGKHGTV